MSDEDALTSWLDEERTRYRRLTPTSARLFERASQVLPGGDTRYSLAMDPYPTYADEASGTGVFDADGRRLLDLIYNATSLVHGHVHPEIADAIRRQAGRSTATLAPNTLQVELAEELCGRVESLERLRFTNSGTEATMMMIKTARGFSGRDLVLKMDGAYHGTFDAMEFNARAEGSSEAVPYTGGVPANIGQNVVVGRYNDADGVVALIEKHAAELAAVIVTPMASTGTWEAPEPGFLEALREATLRHGVLLLFDEVIAFRIGHGGAQGRYGVRPDLTAFGKLIGGGMPVGAFGGRADVMAVTDPTRGPLVAHAGTFNGNPVTSAAGLASLRLLDRAAFDHLEALGARFAAGLRDVVAGLELALDIRHQGSLVSIATRPDTPPLWGAVSAAMRLALLNRGVLGSGVFALPTVMTDAEVDAAVAAIRDALEVPAGILAGASA